MLPCFLEPFLGCFRWLRLWLWWCLQFLSRGSPLWCCWLSVGSLRGLWLLKGGRLRWKFSVLCWGFCWKKGMLLLQFVLFWGILFWGEPMVRVLIELGPWVWRLILILILILIWWLVCRIWEGRSRWGGLRNQQNSVNMLIEFQDKVYSKELIFWLWIGKKKGVLRVGVVVRI